MVDETQKPDKSPGIPKDKKPAQGNKEFHPDDWRHPDNPFVPL